MTPQRQWLTEDEIDERIDLRLEDYDKKMQQRFAAQDAVLANIGATQKLYHEENKRRLDEQSKSLGSIEQRMTFEKVERETRQRTIDDLKHQDRIEQDAFRKTVLFWVKIAGSGGAIGGTFIALQRWWVFAHTGHIFTIPH